MKIAIVFASILLSGISYGQYGFSRYYGSPALNISLYGLEPTADGGFASMTSTVRAFDRTNLIKFDAAGDTLWTRDIGNEGDFRGLSSTDDNSLLVSGVTLMKIDQTGNLLWSNQYSEPANGIAQTGFSKVVGIGNGGAMLASETYQYFNSGNNYESTLSVYRFDTNGDTLWTRHLSGANFNSVNLPVNVAPFAIHANDLGEIYAFGTRTQSSSYNFIMWKLDANGNTLWLKEYASTTIDRLSSSFISANDEILLSGYTNGLSGAGGRVIKIDSNGDFMWSKVLVVSNSGRASSIIELHNGDLAIGVDNLPIGSLDYQSGLYITDDTVGIVKTILHGGEATGGGSGIIQLSDFGIVNTVSTNAFSAQSVTNYQKVDTLGNTVGCYEEIFSPSVVDNNIAIVDLIMTETQGGTYTAIPTVFGGSNVEEYDFGFDIVGVVTPGACNGDQGTISLNLNGNAPYEFQWSNGTTAEDLVEFSGTYSVIVEDASGCLRRDTFMLTEPDEISASFAAVNVDCFGASNGSIDLTVTGGTPGYSYQWSTLDTTQDLSNLGGGFYQCIISDTNGCNSVVGVAVAEPQQLTAVISSTSNVSCNGLCDGQLTGFAAGGTAPYLYQWNDPMSQTQDTATNLCYGNYLLTVTDANGCLAYSNATISEPVAIQNTVTSYESDCFSSNGYAVASTFGGTAPYMYNWNSNGFNSLDSIDSLEVGSYDLIIEDANGCTFNETFAIGSNTNPVELCVVTVDTNNQNVLVWEKPIANNIAGFNIYRNIAGVYTQVGYQPYDSISEYVDNDFGVDPEITSYRYKISVLDSCGNESALSDFHETIHLTANLGVGGEANLIWDDYEGVAFNEYEIWRDTTGNGDWETIGTTLSSSFTYTDNNVPQNAVTLRYAVEVVLPNSCTSQRANTYGSTRSNKRTVAGPASDNTSNIEETILSEMKVYPNPAKDMFVIAINALEWEYVVYDLSGRVISSGLSSNYETEINVTNFESGVYLVEVNYNGVSKTQKVVKH